MGMVAILFNGVELFEQVVNISSKEGSMWNLVKTVSEKKMFKDYKILCPGVCPGEGWITPS